MCKEANATWKLLYKFVICMPEVLNIVQLMCPFRNINYL